MLVCFSGACEKTATAPAPVAPYRSDVTPPLDLEATRWQRRVLILFTDSYANPAWRQQVERLDARQADLLDRDLIVYTAAPGEASDEELRGKFKVPLNEPTILLIGKDGGEKLRAPMPTDIQPILDLIDQMPMRQAEMRRP